MCISLENFWPFAIASNASFYSLKEFKPFKFLFFDKNASSLYDIIQFLGTLKFKKRGGDIMDEETKKDSENTENTDKNSEKEEEMEDEELFNDEDDFNEEDNSWEKTRLWMQENLRVILSVLIVALIAIGIYNYSRKPAEEPSNQIDKLVGDQEVVPQENQNADSSNIAVKDQADNKDVVVKDGQGNGNQNKAEAPTTPKPATETPKAETTAQKTEGGLTVTAGSGDSLTKLSRKALQEYLAANPDAELTKEHKIYIEDLLRRQIAGGRVKIGDSRVFADGLMKDAIVKSKQLNERQLKNLQKYSARVAGL